MCGRATKLHLCRSLIWGLPGSSLFSPKAHIKLSLLFFSMLVLLGSENSKWLVLGSREKLCVLKKEERKIHDFIYFFVRKNTAQITTSTNYI